jgi:MYXO-CTERM domain-containing protein
MLTTSALVVIDGGALDMTNAVADSLVLTGNLEVADGGTLVLDVFSESLFDSLMISGFADFFPLSGIEFNLDIDAFDLFDGFSVDFLEATAVFGFGFLDFTFTGLDPLYTASVSELDGVMSLTLNTTSSVPEAPALALFGAGLLGLFGIGLARRRRDAAA